MHLIRCDATASYETNTHFRRCFRLTNDGYNVLDEFKSLDDFLIELNSYELNATVMRRMKQTLGYDAPGSAIFPHERCLYVHYVVHWLSIPCLSKYCCFATFFVVIFCNFLRWKRVSLALLLWAIALSLLFFLHLHFLNRKDLTEIDGFPNASSENRS